MHSVHDPAVITYLHDVLMNAFINPPKWITLPFSTAE
ncbi:hypothetical protein XF_0333 [Xylella fastidiosa 9a5c]|uniref:Uncharacterized protein n=1 Tax=Xylella fastidiosa (strain 9a5c) TaxID=160492 RepID=Q9PGG9_XYLFA|nr:hypothetical protein XF_0333 [Xylella fastidiosa 9a5c]